MKNIRLKVIENCDGDYWWYAICEGRKKLMGCYGYERKANAIRFAKAMAKKVGIPYDPEIIKKHGC